MSSRDENQHDRLEFQLRQVLPRRYQQQFPFYCKIRHDYNTYLIGRCSSGVSTEFGVVVVILELCK